MSADRKNFVALIVLTAGAVLLMVTIGAGTGGLGILDDGGLDPGKRADKGGAPLPKSPVVVYDAVPEEIEIIDTFAGMVKPFERYTLAFEIGGEIAELGRNATGEPVDVGNLVRQGDLLARLDERLLQAQLKEAKARLEQAQSEMRRSEELKERGDRTITEQAYLDSVTKLRLAETGMEMAETRLEHAELRAPATGKISMRRCNVGEAINPQQQVFELVEVDRVLLVLGVPESRISEIRTGQSVHVELIGRDRFGERLPVLDGKVHEVSPTADDRTGLFAVEVLVQNQDDRLPPGKVARGRVVVDTLRGYRLPVTSAVFRDGKTILFTVNEAGQAESLELLRWVEQGPEVILPIDALPDDRRRVVVRGQHRLTDGREVEMAGPAPGIAPGSESAQPTPVVSVQSN